MFVLLNDSSKQSLQKREKQAAGTGTCIMHHAFGVNVWTWCAQGVFRGLGDTRSPLWATLICNGLNICLDALFIIYLGWGVTGAAWATIIGQVEYSFLVYSDCTCY